VRICVVPSFLVECLLHRLAHEHIITLWRGGTHSMESAKAVPSSKWLFRKVWKSSVSGSGISSGLSGWRWSWAVVLGILSMCQEWDLE
jgi:hypothetical protein